MIHRSVWLLYSVSLSLASRRGPAAFTAAFRPLFSISTARHTSSLILPSISSPPSTLVPCIPRGGQLFHSRSNDDDDGSNGKKLVGPAVQPPRPNGNTYWVIPNVFIAGEYPGDRSGTEEATRTKLKRYLDLGITAFFDLTFPGEKNDYRAILEDEAKKVGKTVEYHRFSIPDFGIPSDPSLMKELLEEMNRAMNERKQTVYVHCRGGIGRTGTTVGCFLKQYGNYDDGEEALQELNRMFKSSGRSLESSYSPETPDQIRFVKEWNSS